MSAISRILPATFAGALGAVLGLTLYTELARMSGLWIRDATAGGLIGATLGFWLSFLDPFRDRAWIRLARAVAPALLLGGIGGAIGLLVGEWVQTLFQGGLLGRSSSWAILGLFVGLSLGVAGRSVARIRNGVVGGLLGGGAGGFVFEAIREALGPERYDLSQGLGMAILGGGLGASFALVEQAFTRAWLVVLNGRQEGRAYPLDRGVIHVGRDERADIGLFGDLSVARSHLRLEQDGGGWCAIVLTDSGVTFLNGSAINSKSDLRDGDQIQLGATRVKVQLR